MKETYVIAKYDDDPCEEESTPFLILTTNNQDMLKPYQRYGYDIYVADSNGNLKRIQEWYQYPYHYEDDSR